MTEGEPPKKEQAAGAPAWVMTFADLMSLLMCFFVLLLSFSEMDVSKYKQLAGSMANAFGVQREVKVKDPPKGINIIAREFSPGRPEPTPMNVVRQMTTADLKIHLDVGGEKKSKRTPKASKFDPREERTISPAPPGAKQGDLADEHKKGKAGDEVAGAAQDKKAGQAGAQTGKQSKDAEDAGKGGVMLDEATAKEIQEARERAERRMQMEANARKISASLREQIKDGAVDVEKEGQKIVIRIREKASFGSGNADIKSAFKPVLWKLGEIIEGTKGRVVVAGHTDNIPVSGKRYRSNWELSSARAVSVIHELLWQTAMPLNRFIVQGHGETQPIAANDSRANRAKNRRVEIILLQGEDKESSTEISQKGKTQKKTVPPNVIESTAKADAGKDTLPPRTETDLGKGSTGTTGDTAGKTPAAVPEGSSSKARVPVIPPVDTMANAIKAATGGADGQTAAVQSMLVPAPAPAIDGVVRLAPGTEGVSAAGGPTSRPAGVSAAGGVRGVAPKAGVSGGRNAVPDPGETEKSPAKLPGASAAGGTRATGAAVEDSASKSGVSAAGVSAAGVKAVQPGTAEPEKE